MKIFLVLLVGGVAGYAALIWVLGHLDTLALTLCSAEFSGPGIVCRFSALSATVLLVPLSAVLAGWCVSRLYSR